MFDNLRRKMIKTLSKTAALKKAQSAVSAPIGSRTSWQVYGPYRADDLSGPSTAVNYNGYTKAVNSRCEWVAMVALALMGRANLMDRVDEIAYRDGPMAATVLVNTVLNLENLPCAIS